jgi:hypothetical protein
MAPGQRPRATCWSTSGRRAVWSPRSAMSAVDHAVLLPAGPVTATRMRGRRNPAGAGADLLREGRKSEVVSVSRRRFRASSTKEDHRMGLRFHDPVKGAGALYVYLPYTQSNPRSRTRGTRARPTGTGPTSPRWTTASTIPTSSTAEYRRRHHRGVDHNGTHTTYRFPAIDPDPAGGPVARVLRALAGRVIHLAEAPAGRRAWSAGPRVPAGKVSNELVHQVDSSPRW